MSYEKRFGLFKDDVKRLARSQLFQYKYNMNHATCLGEFAVRKTLESALNVPTNEKNAGIWQKCSLLEKGEGESVSGTAAGDQARAGCWQSFGCG